MTSDRCPKDDPLQAMSAGNVFEVICPSCDYEIEFLGNERQRKCAKCGEIVVNPHLAPEEPS